MRLSLLSALSLTAVDAADNNGLREGGRSLWAKLVDAMFDDNDNNHNQRDRNLQGVYDCTGESWSSIAVGNGEDTCLRPTHVASDFATCEEDCASLGATVLCVLSAEMESNMHLFLNGHQWLNLKQHHHHGVGSWKWGTGCDSTYNHTGFVAAENMQRDKQCAEFTHEGWMDADCASVDIECVCQKDPTLLVGTPSISPVSSMGDDDGGDYYTTSPTFTDADPMGGHSYHDTIYTDSPTIEDDEDGMGGTSSTDATMAWGSDSWGSSSSSTTGATDSVPTGSPVAVMFTGSPTIQDDDGGLYHEMVYTDSPTIEDDDGAFTTAGTGGTLSSTDATDGWGAVGNLVSSTGATTSSTGMGGSTTSTDATEGWAPDSWGSTTTTDSTVDVPSLAPVGGGMFTDSPTFVDNDDGGMYHGMVYTDSPTIEDDDGGFGMGGSSTTGATTSNNGSIGDWGTGSTTSATTSNGSIGNWGVGATATTTIATTAAATSAMQGICGLGLDGRIDDPHWSVMEHNGADAFCVYDMLEPMKYSSCVRDCNSLGATMPCLSNAAMEADVADYLVAVREEHREVTASMTGVSYDSGAERVWIGKHDMDGDGIFQWDPDSKCATSYDNMDPDESNDDSKKCLAWEFDYNGVIGWKREDCEAEYYVECVCLKSLM